MKITQAWIPQDMQILPGPRHRTHMKRPMWIIILVSFIIVFLFCAYMYPPQGNSACYIFSSRGCKVITDWLPPAPARELTDEEVASHVVIREILNSPIVPSKTPKIAFMFLTPGSLPFEKLWDKFFNGHEDKFTVYVHASKEKPTHVSIHFLNRDIHSNQVVWGKITMVDAERRLLANALQNPDNHHFVLLSDSCVPLYSFDYIYKYLMPSNISFVDSFKDPGPHGNGRYSEHMLPEVEEKHFRKGAQWFTLKRQHALIVLADNLYYNKFRNYCQPGFEGRNCIADEHYLPTFFNIVDPTGIANWSVTHVDWSERKWHPKSYRAEDLTDELLQNITSIDVSVHVTSDKKKEVQRWPCVWNGLQRPCYLFARKCQIFQRMRNYSIYTCSVTIRIVVGFSILIWAFQFDFPPFMVLIIAMLNDGTIMTISKDRVRPSPYPDAWNLREIFSYAIVYGLYLTASTVGFVAVCLKTNFFADKFGLKAFTDANDYVLHSVVYLQVSTISQGLIFITRSRGWFFTERPSVLLVCSFVIAQLVATFIAVYANWGFTSIEGCGWGYAGVAWIWNFIWFAPMDLVKFGMQYFFEPTTTQHNPEEAKAAASRRASAVSGTSSARYYANRTRSLKSMERPQNFASKIMGKSGKKMDPKEMRRLSSVQASHAGKVLSTGNA